MLVNSRTRRVISTFLHSTTSKYHYQTMWSVTFDFTDENVSLVTFITRLISIKFNSSMVGWFFSAVYENRWSPLQCRTTKSVYSTYKSNVTITIKKLKKLKYSKWWIIIFVYKNHLYLLWYFLFKFEIHILCAVEPKHLYILCLYFIYVQTLTKLMYIL